MKKALLLSFGLLITSFVLKADEKIKINASEQDAVIYVDGKPSGSSAEIKIDKGSCVTVKVVKTGFLTETLSFCDKKNAASIPKTLFVDMKRDDSYDASTKIDFANNDIDVRTSKSEADAWRLMNQIITSQFDIIEITDRETGYLRTAWAVQSFKGNTIRTRVVVKLGSNNPLYYKIKLMSEQSGEAGTSPKADEKFVEWDRILRKYENIVNEIQTRIK
ncbi:MAG: hypothetical protein ACO1NS_07205 [Daejeonella sp.]|uniref:hypothetical protein n=1 Tax=Daejeonella sp. JGW-45 TaxID=3034148 RepID=UPI0023EAC7F3|nr:hypothetical protein [Daejeonella sp. JGW-45]